MMERIGQRAAHRSRDCTRWWLLTMVRGRPSPRSSGTGSVPEDQAQDDIWERGDCLPHEFDNTMLLAWVFPTKLWRKIEVSSWRLWSHTWSAFPSAMGSCPPRLSARQTSSSMDTLMPHINALLRSSLGTLTSRACGGSGLLQARSTGRSADQPACAMAEASAAATVEATAAHGTRA
jgi:hypothetical protein